MCGDFVCSPTVEILHSRPWQYAAESPAQEVTWDSLLKYLESNALFLLFVDVAAEKAYMIYVGNRRLLCRPHRKEAIRG